MLSAYGFSSLRAEGVSVTAPAARMEGKVISCDYGKRTITVSGVPADESLVGMPVRILNDLRSTVHTITGVAPAGELTQLTLSTTALRNDGWVAAVSEGGIRNGAPSPWAFDTYLAGTRVVSEDGRSEWLVTSAAGGWWSAPTGTRLSLRAPDGAPATREALSKGLTDANGDGDAEFRIYEFGRGDRVELQSFAHLKRTPDGRWEGVMSPGVQVQ